MKIDDKIVNDMRLGRKNNKLLREGLCGKDVRNIDMSNLSYKMFQFLSFDSDTIFSDEQRNKFHIDELMNKRVGNGKGGKGIKVAIIDTAIDTNHELLKDVNFNYIDVVDKGEIENHGMTVLSAYLDVAPDSEIYYFPSNKYSNCKDLDILKIVKEIVNRGDIKIISYSSSIMNDKAKEEINKLLKNNDIKMIDSYAFYKDFSYYINTLDDDGNEIFNNGFCEYEEPESNKFLKRVMLNFKKTRSNIGEKRAKNRGKPQIMCGGRVYAQNDNKYKYCSYCCASYAIPQLSALFAIAREYNNKISFDSFVDLIKSSCDLVEKNGINNNVINFEKYLDLLKKNYRKDFKDNLIVNYSTDNINIKKDNDKIKADKFEIIKSDIE